MPRRADRSVQTLAVLEAITEAADPRSSPGSSWCYGYDLARRTGLASGTLYPILARLADRGYLEREWESDPPSGRPPRHLYRLSRAGAELLREVRTDRIPTASRPVRVQPTTS